MDLIKRESILWFYLPDEIKDLFETGETVLGFIHEQRGKVEISDYSFCVFSFAKAYEGFLKKLFLDMGIIEQHEYYSDDIRIGRLLSPHFMEDKGSVFYRMCKHPKGGSALSQRLWDVWRNGRNLVFHYFPHNYRKLDYSEAFEIITSIVDTMGVAVTSCVHVSPSSGDSNSKEKTSIIHS